MTLHEIDACPAPPGPTPRFNFSTLQAPTEHQPHRTHQIGDVVRGVIILRDELVDLSVHKLPRRPPNRLRTPTRRATPIPVTTEPVLLRATAHQARTSEPPTTAKQSAVPLEGIAWRAPRRSRSAPQIKHAEPQNRDAQTQPRTAAVVICAWSRTSDACATQPRLPPKMNLDPQDTNPDGNNSTNQDHPGTSTRNQLCDGLPIITAREESVPCLPSRRQCRRCVSRNYGTCLR